MTFGPVAIALTSTRLIVVMGFVIYFAWVLRRGRSAGTSGIVQRSRLLCRKCGKEFDYG
jgi:flagellar biogenesis protein FliO